MFLVIFLDQDNYEFNVSLHPSLGAAEAAFEALMREFVIAPAEPYPPKRLGAGFATTAEKPRISTRSSATETRRGNSPEQQQRRPGCLIHSRRRSQRPAPFSFER